MNGFPQEQDVGNVEYKQQLLNLTPTRREQLKTQLMYRLDQGGGECRYELGVADDGSLVGLSQHNLDISTKNLQKLAEQVSACLFVISTTEVETDKFIREAMVRKNNDTDYIDLTIAVIGSVDCAKSTLLGVLTSNELDDGRGKARLTIFNHPHERNCGRTSSISFHIIGFDNAGNIINAKNERFRRNSWPDIVSESTKVVTFIDMPGHDKYLRTTITGITGTRPDYAIVMVGGNLGITNMTKEHLVLCLVLRIPFIIVISKIDIAPKHILDETVQRIKRILKIPGVLKIPHVVNSEEDLPVCIQNTHKGDIVPIIKLSCKTGENLDLLKKLLNCLQPRTNYSKLISQPVELHIIEVFSVRGIGTVVHGLLCSGSLRVGQSVLIGPCSDSRYIKTRIKSIHCKRVGVQKVTAGKHVCINIKVDRHLLKRGMVVISENNVPKAVKKFRANIRIFKGAHKHSTIRIGYEPVINTNTIKASAKIISIEEELTNFLRPGEHASVVMAFKTRPQYINKNTIFFFRQGLTVGAGKIVDLL